METGYAGVDMTDPAIIAASYAAERNYSHNPDDVVNASDAVLAIGTEKIDTTTLKDKSPENNDATIHGAMPTEGFIQGRRFDKAHDDYLDCGNDSSLDAPKTMYVLMKQNSATDGYIQAKGNSYRFKIQDGTNLRGILYINSSLKSTKDSMVGIGTNVIFLAGMTYDGKIVKLYRNGTEVTSYSAQYVGNGDIDIVADNFLIGRHTAGFDIDGIVYAFITSNNIEDMATIFNTLARLPFWSVNYTDYPDNVTEYTDNLPYSSSIISSGTFKVDADKLQCVSAGTITYSASYEFDGSEYIKIKIGSVEYAGTGTITQGNTTVSVAQGSNKITIEMGTGDKIDDEINIQFRKEV